MHRGVQGRDVTPLVEGDILYSVMIKLDLFRMLTCCHAETPAPRITTAAVMHEPAKVVRSRCMRACGPDDEYATSHLSFLACEFPRSSTGPGPWKSRSFLGRRAWPYA